MDIGALPKAELHCHLDGVPDPAMLRTLLGEGVDLPIDPEALEAAYPVRDLASFGRWFDVEAGLIRGRFDVYHHLARVHIERLKAQNVVYAEWFVAGIAHATTFRTTSKSKSA